MLRRSACVARRALTARRRLSAAAHYYPSEPSAPVLVTDSVPGPKSAQILESLGEIYDNNTANFVVDYRKSIGNYIADADGNMMLDVFQQIASIALGYNNPALIAAAQSEDQVVALVNRPALAVFPSADYGDILRTGLLKAAPPGMKRVWTSSHGSDANEMAYKAAFMLHHARERGDRDFSAAEIASSMLNQPPGCSKKTILSFNGAFHGRLFGSLSTTRSKPIHKLDIPAFDWPVAPFPQLQYPLEDHVDANKLEEQRCLEAVDTILAHGDVAAVVVEPVQSEGGDNHASPQFFQQLRKITQDRGVFLIVDEVQTGGGGTGKFWAHEHWNLPSPPDMVTFSKKMQAAGFYYAEPDLQPKLAYRQFHTWCGDPSKAIIARAIIDEVQKHGLVDATAATGDYLYAHLAKLQDAGKISRLRGQGMGTFIAFDLPTADARNQLVAKLKQLGVVAGGCGDKSVRLRPSLTFGTPHADVFIDKLHQAL